MNRTTQLFLATLTVCGGALPAQTLNQILPSLTNFAFVGAAGQPLASQFAVRLTDAMNDPLVGFTVTFTAPASGPSGTFAGGTTVAFVSTNASGIATAPVFTLNSTVGPAYGLYQVTATADGASTTFYAANCAAGNPVVTSTADSGPGSLRDAFGNACPAASLTFALPNPSTITLLTSILGFRSIPSRPGLLYPIDASILGPGETALTISGGNLVRPFYLQGSLDVTRPQLIANLTIANGRAKSGNGSGGGGGAAGVGGGMLVTEGLVNLANVLFQGNTAIGGDGSVRSTTGGGGGGGGLAGDGQTFSVNAGGAGGPGGTSSLPDGGAGGPSNPAGPGQAGTAIGAGGGGGSTGFAGGDGLIFGGGGGAGFGPASINQSPKGGNGGPFGGGAGGGGTAGGSAATAGIFGGAGGFDALHGYGGGGAGLGGAIYSTGYVNLANVAFVSNSVAGGQGQSGSPFPNQPKFSQDGEAKGGGVATAGAANSSYGGLTFVNNSASGAGTGTACTGADTTDVCGTLSPTPPANLLLLPSSPDNFVVVGGSRQTTPPNTTFPTTLSVQLYNGTVGSSSFFPRANYLITFTAPSSGASGTFAGGLTSVTAITDSNGIATAPSFTANGAGGSYAVIASIGALSTPLTLTNGLPAGTTMSYSAGSPQTAMTSTVFGTNLQVMVKTASNQPLPGATVLFSAPASGASGAFGEGRITASVITDASGLATAPPFAANLALGAYTVTATLGAQTVNFSLTNTLPAGSTLTIAAGNNQTAAPGTAFAALQVVLKDSSNRRLPGGIVTFTAPTTGASGTFPGNVSTVMAVTDATGTATAPAFNANFTVNTFTLTASLSGLSATFNLSVGAPPGSFFTMIQGDLQTTRIGQPFAKQFQATLRDPLGIPIAGVPIVFQAPGGGASGAFSTGGNSAQVTTDTNGVATAPVFTANEIGGSYGVIATPVVGLATGTFSLTNSGPSSISLTPNSGFSVMQGGRVPLVATMKLDNGSPATTPSNCQVQAFTFGTPLAGCYYVELFDANNSPLTTVLSNEKPDDSGHVSFPYTTGGQIGSFTITARSFRWDGTKIVYGISASTTYNVSTVATLTAVSGSNQIVSLGQGTVPLSAVAKDASGNVMVGVAVQFVFPPGSVLTFDGYGVATVLTDVTGTATAPPFAYTTFVSAASQSIQAIATTGLVNATFSIIAVVPPGPTPPVTLSTPSSNGVPNVPVEFDVNVTPSSATGQVFLFVDGSPAGSTKLPVSRIFVTFGKSGTHEIQAQYQGDARNLPANSPALQFNVIQPNFSGPTVPIVVGPTPTPPGHNNTGNGCQFFVTYDISIVGGGCPHSPSFSGFARTGLQPKAVTQTPPISDTVTYVVGPGPHALVLGDFDGDGIADLLATNAGNSTISFLKGNNTALDPPVSFSVPLVPGPLVAGDFNHDGNLDFAYGTADGKIVIGLNYGNATFALLNPIVAGSSVAAMTATDLNGDGWVDLVVADGTTGQLLVFLNDKTGKLIAVPNPLQPGTDPRSIVVADFNRDGKPDLAVAYYQQGVAILLGKGDGTFGAPKFLPGTMPTSVAFGQFNGDPFLDLVVAYDKSTNVAIFAGNGDGTFQTPIFKTVGTDPNSVLVGDFNGDGRLDILTTNATSSDITAVLGTPAPVAATPTIQWPKPADIIVGSALGSAQLNATAVNAMGALVAGTFTYTPAAGTVPPVGDNQTLSVQFVPTDTASYHSASATTTINVKPTQGQATLVITSTLARDPSTNEVVVSLTFAYSGTPGTAATNIQLTTAKIAATSTSTALPAAIANVPGGGSSTFTVRFPAPVGSSGTQTSLTIGGTYSGGTFSSAARVKLP